MSREDLGVAYESFVKIRYLEDLCARFGLESMLETHRGSEEDALLAGGLRMHAVVLKSRGCQTSVRSLGACDIVESELSHMPFRSRTFDIVCSSDLVKWSPSTAKYVEEMGRVSKRFVLIFTPNLLHIGHLIKRRFSREARWIGNAHRSWLSVKHICNVLMKVGLRIVEVGKIDAPPWPSHLSVRNLARRSGLRWRWDVAGKKRCPRIIWIFAEMERKMPGWLKAFQGHISYVLASKEGHED